MKREGIYLKIICMDDSISGVISLQQQVQSIIPNAQIYACVTPDNAVMQAEKNGCDVLLTEIDVGNSSTGGILTAERIKQINPRVNIIFLTVCSEYEHAARLLPMRISGYLTKPFHTDALSHELHNLRFAVS